ncbi:hypothetical protein [Methylobacterium sp. 391_Methyba4]|uniref:hypothetical protein n=1 Tax=Methylobacterium sp. 391_Methyba4 TaxID=3038924 RepID=UPI00241CA5AB|nr:hypothetical protein [Methylobacterium sp. 391_Methyba4]WFS07621.1 hypothetical protein P9K36_30450 [Methylobacterium sp. 391_Methyba4]
MKATITLLGRATEDDEFAQLWTGSAEVSAGTTSVTPVVPAAAAGHELAVSVLSSDGSVNFASFAVIPPAPAADGEPDAAPASPRLERRSSVYATRAGQARRAPFAGSLVALCRVGTPQPTA